MIIPTTIWKLICFCSSGGLGLLSNPSSSPQWEVVESSKSITWTWTDHLNQHHLSSHCEPVLGSLILDLGSFRHSASKVKKWAFNIHLIKKKKWLEKHTFLMFVRNSSLASWKLPTSKKRKEKKRKIITWDFKSDWTPGVFLRVDRANVNLLMAEMITQIKTLYSLLPPNRPP